ncbi:unnamed protein product [Symbiodinium sp. CCMP2592]|nr:unnamed protein product [Symbiodinium sp. CCMP2592]
MAVAQPAPRVTRWSSRQPELSQREGRAGYLDTPALDDLPPHEESLPKSTADCWNRLRDKDRVEAELGLYETGGEEELFDASAPSRLIARGYRRIVFGDHGPYVEFEASQIVWENLPEVILKPSHAYYDEYWAQGGFVKLYKQKRSVQHKRNPPTGGVRHDREGGYADYKVGMCYISPSQLTAATRGARASADDARSRRWKK